MELVKVQVRAFLGRTFRNSEIRDEDNIFELGYVNSMFAMQLVLFVEKNFGITVDNDDLELDNFSTVNAIAQFVERKTTNSHMS